MSRDPLKVAVLISGTGRSLQNLIRLQQAGQLPVIVALVISSRTDADGLRFARAAKIPEIVVDRSAIDSIESFSAAIFDPCRLAGIELVVMAGFLKLVQIPADFEGRVINIHPSLIPAFCGRGFYGERVHRAVIESGARVSGCTVHYVDNEYDHGPVILQRLVAVLDDDTPHSLADRVFAEECVALPEAIACVARSLTPHR